MRTAFFLFIVCSVAIGFPIWQALGPEGIGNGLTGITQSHSDPLTIYAVGGTETQGNYIIESQSVGGGWDMISSPNAKYILGGIMAITPDDVMLFAQPSQDQIARSTNYGQTWSWVAIQSDYSTVRDIVTLPSSMSSAWAVGKGQDGGYPYRAYFWKTEDSGLSWSTEDLITTASELYRVSVCEADPNIIYVAGQMNTSPAVPLIMRSSDGGASWIDVTPQESLIEDSIGLGVAVSPVNPLLVLFSTRRNVYRSQDGGQTWDAVNDEDWVFDIEYSAANPDLAFAGGEAAVLRSLNAGLSWSRVPIGSPEEIVRVVLPSRTDENVVSIGTSGGYQYSSDKGENWIPDNDGMMFVKTGSIASSSGSAPRLYMVIDDALSASDDLSATWFECVTPPEMDTYGIDILVDPFNKDNLVCLENTGEFFHSTDGGFTWAVDDSSLSHGGDVAADPNNPGVLYIAGRRGVPGYSWGSLGRSEDSGATWSFQDVGDSQSTIYTIAMDPVHPDTMYVGGTYTSTQGCLIYRTMDGGSTWTAVQTPVSYSPLTDIAVSADDPSILLVTGYNGLFRSDDFGVSWTHLFSYFYSGPVFFDPYVPQRVWFYQGISTYKGIHFSDDAGLTWTEWNEGLVTWADVNSLTFIPGLWLYASTACAAFRLDISGVGIADDAIETPGSSMLSVSPNPLRGAGSIQYTTTEAEPIEFMVIDLAGRVVARFSDQPEQAGINTVSWLPRTEQNQPLCTGVYFIRMSSNSEVSTIRVILLN